MSWKFSVFCLYNFTRSNPETTYILVAVENKKSNGKVLKNVKTLFWKRFYTVHDYNNFSPNSRRLFCGSRSTLQTRVATAALK